MFQSPITALCFSTIIMLFIIIGGSYVSITYNGSLFFHLQSTENAQPASFAGFNHL